MKKAISLTLALVMLLLVSVPAFAADITASGNSANTTVKVAGSTATSSFTVTIPASVDIVWDTQQTAVEYTVSNKLETGKCVQVVVSGDGEMKNDEGTGLPYSLTDTIFKTNAAVVTDAKATVTVNVATSDWDAASIDDYEGTLTFTATIENL